MLCNIYDICTICIYIYEQPIKPLIIQYYIVIVPQNKHKLQAYERPAPQLQANTIYLLIQYSYYYFILRLKYKRKEKSPQK